MFARKTFFMMLGFAATALSTRSADAVVLIHSIDRNTETLTALNENGGFFDWIVDGTNHLDQEWFWIRVNDDAAETSISALDSNDRTSSDGNFEPGDERLFARWYDGQDRFEVTLDQIVTGGPAGSAVSDVTQTLRISNQTDEPLLVNLFELADFDLLDTTAGDTVEVISDNVIMQTELSSFVRETYSTDDPSTTTTQVALDGAIFASLIDNGITNLDGSVGPLTGDDVEYAVQWTTTIPVGGTFFVTKDMFISAPDSIVPEPGACALFLTGVVILITRRKLAMPIRMK